MIRRFPLALCLLLLLPGIAAAQYPVQQRLCDVSFENCRTQILDLINAETQSIDVAFWFMEDARYSNALINRFRAGVKVRVLFDTQAFSEDGPSIVRQQIIDSMASAGIPLRYKSTGGILHWKLMIFGGQRILDFSAANFSPTGYVPTTPYQNYEDETVAFVTEDSIVNTFMTKYDDVWTTTSGYATYANVTTLDRYYPTYPLDPRLNFVPYQNYSSRLVKELDAENQQMDIDMYRITDAKPADAAIRAVQRGVTVRLYTEQQQYRDPTRLWHSYNVDRMYAAGVQVRDRQHDGLNHQKSVLLYGKNEVIFGSSNWTTPSAASQLEHNLFTFDPTWVNFFTDQFNRKWNNTGPSPETKPFVPLPPDKPVYQAPANGATDQSTSGVTLKWYAGLWAHKYDIYFGTTPTLTSANLVAADVELGPSQSTNSFISYAIPGPLAAGATYYWKIVSRTMANLTATGPVWSLVTAGGSGGSTLPAGWSSADIGAVGAAGNATFDSNTGQFVVSGSGADIWGTNDAFRFAFTTLTGDGSIVARVSGLTNEDSWTKAGVMMRDTLAANSAQAMMVVSSGKGLAFQRRTATGGTSTSTSGGGGTAPYWVKLTRAGNTFSAFASTDGSNWTLVGSDTIAMGASINVGLAVTSHDDGTVSTGTFDNVNTGSGSVGGGLPNGWSSRDIGAVGAAGNATYDDAAGRFTVSGSGADIWGTSDEFRFAFTTMTGDGSIVARVASLTNEDAWTKAGVMMRESLTASSAQAMMVVSSAKGLAFQRRTTTGGESTNTSGGAGTAPYWVKLSRTGNSFSAFVSTDGSTWRLVGSDTIAMGSSINVGLAVTSHADGAVSTATFDNVSTSSDSSSGQLPDGWSANDVGGVGAAGSATFDSGTGTFTVRGAGADVWGTTDAFQFAHTTLSGDGAIVARVASVQNVNSWTKAGVMMRDGLDAGAAHATMFVTPSTIKGTAFQRRPTANGTSLSTPGPVVAPPYWVRVVRQGTTFSAYTSPEGTSWTLVDTETIAMSSTINIGLAVSSHVAGTLATATFTDVTVTP